MSTAPTTGEILALAVAQAAAQRGQTIRAFAAPLSKSPNAWLGMLRKVSTPTLETIARVEDLLAGRPVAPPQPSGGKGPRASLSARDEAERL
ncbi:hypothetical protein [Sphingomonas hengshuiensis]|uniref:Uncharacterized protein n=1 Tax=Sphingomonas hengshuiensis TaxID=1609977 RepID=A0A7U4LFC3_9SPHN|nr:hypothetical protein [Sphingomonas hengshuiensis]AJP72290.1 hypothetical protein TS85_11570 [Sphingomonas hengshuiensis]